ncbi:hypothetical protein BASA50_001009 [Batrachochytrium salamandrivorans]|uniref:Uncharacterized protein n=1 Tax=Batrachochytrium salamandrivorans TaxID=1357716 RepID=A0ABQ8ES29_9FUNG|nr:hypothetical protein BASA62_002518 [Batrachochytrium salamandrivorans]KAH6577696.1 hypothetical protein BASA60_003893 [Batrachochytrium salamandrivorans]KAH6584947.1 hypothetical protein BASA61_007168 [Batrachochytrium salamandrivorans]KAH6585675.1 hypothetical protein BASA50_001009 [Batrachochytrium salamandrivorans]KAH9273994.1 hypothetical protein BASA83_003629 [Batrachochytrium salamandrivorans]
MRFKALVVAAMVITSVNAGLLDEAMDCVGRICRLRPRSSRGSQVHEQGSAITHDLAEHETELEPLQESARNESESEPTQNLLGDNSDTPQESEDTKKNRVCGSIKSKFFALWITIYDFDFAFWQEMTEFYYLIAGKKDDLKIKEIREWIEYNFKAIPRLKEIRTVYIGLERDHFELWERLIQKGCPTERLERISPVALKKKGYFPEWYDDNDEDIFDET